MVWKNLIPGAREGALCCLVCLSMTVHAGAQELYVWLLLTGDRVVVNATVEEMRGDSLRVTRGGRSLLLPVREIEEIRIMRESSLLQGAAVGAGIGIVAGTLAGFLARPSDDQHATVERAALTLGLVGSIVGSVAGSTWDMGRAEELTGRSVEEKKTIINRLISPQPGMATEP